MNNLDPASPILSNEIDSTFNGTLNIVEIPDAALNNWNEFWITMEANGPAIGATVITVYMNGSTTPAGTFNVSLAASGNAAYSNQSNPYLELGSSTNGGYGAVDTDFFSYKLGVLAPTAALSASISGVPEPTTLVLLAMGTMGLCGVRRRRFR